MNVAVVGTGYVGLVTATCLAESGNEVTGVDKDARKVETLFAGKLPIYEPGLLELVQRNRREGRLQFTTDLGVAVKSARLVFIAVGTPQGDTGEADLSAIWAVGDEIARHLKDAPPGPPGSRVIVIKSTVPVGTNTKLHERLKAAGCAHLDVASNPEFLKEGAAVDDFMKPDRIVVGVRRPEVADVLHELYAPFLRTEQPFLAMSPESAEMTKYAANAMLATKISFVNEMANLCDRLGADINDVRRGIGHDARIGFQFLHPGPGYGGSCFPGDETLFVETPDGLRTTSFAELFARAAGAVPAGRRLVAVGPGGPAMDELPEAVAVVPPAPVRVLAYDLERGGVILSEVRAVTRRPYRDDMVRLATTMGRRLTVTADHPVVTFGPGGPMVRPAADVLPGDRLAAAHDLPVPPAPAALNLVDLLAGTTLEADVHVTADDGAFTTQYDRFKAHVPADLYRYPLEIKAANRMPLWLYRHLSRLGVLDVPADRLLLYTAKGAATRVRAVIPVDTDLLRLCGYYAAEGYISREAGRAGAVRDRIGFAFHVDEREYLEDVQRILGRYGMKFLVRECVNSHVTYASSRVFAWLLRDVLGLGTRSEDKALPALAFGCPSELRLELIRGAFSGDGAVTPVQGGRNFMLEYATVSRALGHGLALLLQSLGVVPSVRVRRMNKSKSDVYLLRVSGFGQLSQLANAFGARRRARIDALLAGYQSHIKQRGFDRAGPVSLLKVRSAERVPADEVVYSLESDAGTVVVASGLVAHNCFPKDVQAILGMGRALGLPLDLQAAVDQVNRRQKLVLFEKISRHFGGALKGKTIAVWGLAFKPRTDDIRESPALALIDRLLEAGASVRAHDPEAMANVKAVYGDKLVYADRPYGALEGADGLAVVTEWPEFRNPDFEVMRRLLGGRVIFDGRNLYDPRAMRGYGFTYYGIGRAGDTADRPAGAAGAST